ncbi:L,D-transpeptidase [Candidatus Gottesmanbacteria bacterium]|nr:L,D-transpeptidase [Candidatus Gottesmanbacteria bacterium]
MKRHVLHAVNHARKITHHLRQKRILTRKKILTLFTVINMLFVLMIGTNILSFPNTMVGSANLGLMTKEKIRSHLSAYYATSLPLIINAQSYDLTYEHLGIYMDPDAVEQEIFAPNRKPFFQKIPAMIRQLFTPRRIQIPLSFSQEFYEYVDKINDAGLTGTDIVYIDQNNKQATVYAPQQRYTVDLLQFQTELLHHFGRTDTPLTVPLVEAPNELIEKVANTNANLARTYNSPLTVIVGMNGTNQFITLSPEDLRKYTTASITAETGDAKFTLNTELFLPDLTTALSVYAATFNPVTAVERVGNGIKNALVTRYEGGPAESVKVGVDSGPNTEGELADKYIEIDISQQKLFTFRNKTLVKTYRVSTGKDYPTPVGTFKILNKTGLGFSNIYNVWMPYWMGFEYSKELHAYFGIHELPYFYTGGNKIQRPREFIGVPNTGGCVALDIGDSKEVYQFADIGTPVVIYQ